MHPRLVEKLLDHEIELVRDDAALMERVRDISRDGRRIIVAPVGLDERFALQFSGRNYDAEPLGLTVIDGRTGSTAATRYWPGVLYFGEHPSLKRPFACIRGLYEYHTHFSHLEPWDRCRYNLRFALLLKHVLDKAAL